MINIIILCLLGVITILELIIIFRYKKDLAAIKSQLEHDEIEIEVLKLNLDGVNIAKAAAELKKDMRKNI